LGNASCSTPATDSGKGCYNCSAGIGKEWNGYSCQPNMMIDRYIEVRAMLEGLKIAWACGFHQVEVESDNALLIDIL
ncbi:hypothetical protein Goari_012060, partial [Gossypium aridum]|nr:hypothetical protein [Gossypium aridum]